METSKYNIRGVAIEIRDVQKQQILVDDLRKRLAREEELLKREQKRLYLLANEIYANT
jgi:hypothetical protein